MKFNGTIQNALPEQNGTSKNGKAWRKRTYLCVYDTSNAQYPKSISFDVIGNKIDEFNLQVGGQYELEIDFTANEWNGRYILNATCWKATAIMAQQAPPPQSQQSQSATPTLDAMGVQGYQQVPAQNPPTESDDLPF